MLDQRHRVRDGERRERRGDRRMRSTPLSRPGCAPSRKSWPSASSVAAKAPRSWWPFASSAHGNGRMPNARPGRSQIRCSSRQPYTAAIPTGDGWSPRRAAPGFPSSSRARLSGSAASCCSMRGSRTTRTPRRRLPTSPGKEIDIEVDLGTGGTEQATIWTCDLSAEYVRINADYRT